MHQLIADVLDFSRLSSEDDALSYEPVNLEWLLKEIMADMEVSLQSSGAENSAESIAADRRNYWPASSAFSKFTFQLPKI